MGKAVDIVDKIMQKEKNYEEYGLFFSKKVRKWEAFNLLVGENGSGKSRILQMIKEKAKGKCIVIYLDFANYVQFPDKSEEDLSNEEKTLIDKLIFRGEVENEIFVDFVKNLDNQILHIFKELFDMEKDNNERIRRRIKEVFDDLRPLISNILHREIKVKDDGIYLCKENREVTIEDEWILLSPGERSILVVVFAVLYIKLVKVSCILLIDEIETHLHPSAQVELYKFLKQTLEKSVTDFCTCIASHSIFLLPLFSIHELVYMNNGKIENINGGLYQQIYDNLTGEGDKKEETLTDFLYSMSAWQYADYLAQCFLEPTSVDEAKSDDEQALKFVEVLKTLNSRKELIEVLDFGAGTARIGKCLELMLKDNADVSRLVAKFRYHIYDKNGVSDEIKENTSWMGGAYSSEMNIISSNIKFDIILLYNVLHEIGVDEWVKELGFMLDLLIEGGILLFGEREVLSVGEKPYGKSGYLVLGEEELSKLFPKSDIKEVFLPEKQKTVTLCFAVKKPRTKESYPSEETVKAALLALRDNTKNKIRNRENNGLGERGKSRKYAFYCQQYVNAEEAIEIMDRTGQRGKKLQEQEPKSGDIVLWGNDNTTLTDILQSNFSKSEQIGKISELAQIDSKEGKKCKKYLETHKEELHSLDQERG